MNVHYATRWKTGLYRLKWVFSTSQRRNDKVKRFRHRWKFNRGKILLLVLNAKFKIQNLKNKILNPKINIQNAKIKILDPKAKIKNPKIKILNPKTKIWNLTLKKLKNLKTWKFKTYNSKFKSRNFHAHRYALFLSSDL